MEKKTLKKILYIISISFLSLQLLAQERILMHSHNDYERRMPFYQAYAQEFASIEADIFEQGGELLVAHSKRDLGAARTIDELYIAPIVSLFKLNGNKAWPSSEKTLTLLIDLKTEANPTLDILIKKLEAYPHVFNPSVNPLAVRVIISGNMVAAADFDKYSTTVNFDAQTLDNLSTKQLERVGMMSFNFSKLSSWNGKGLFDKKQYAEVMKYIDAVHTLKKPIRFWASPDGVNAWNILYNMGIDYINTDTPEACADFFRSSQYMSN